MEYRMRKKVTVNEDGHNMRTINENGLDTMIKDSYDIGSHSEVDEKMRNKTLDSGNTKKKMSTRRCFDTSKNTRVRVMSNIGIVTLSGTTIDTRKASDGEFKNSKCVSVDVLTHKRNSFVKKMLSLRG